MKSTVEREREILKKIDDWNKEIAQACSIRYHLIQELWELKKEKPQRVTEAFQRERQGTNKLRR